MKYALVLVLMLVVGGCSPYVAGVYFRPHPGLTEIASTQPSQGPEVSAYASVIGIRKPDSKENLPWTIEVRLRLDNRGTQPITLEQKSLEITTGDLVRFPAPLPAGPAVVTVGPNQSAVITAEFPFPQGRSFDQFDLSSLQLRWLVGFNGRMVQQSIHFRMTYDDDYYWDYGPGYYGYGPYWDGGFYGYAYVGPGFRGGYYHHRR